MSLVEILVAVIILSVGLTCIIQSYLAGLRLSVQSSDYLLASILVQNKMNEILQNGGIDEGIDLEGNFPEPYETFHYGLKTKNIKEGETKGWLNEVNLSIFWHSGKRTNVIPLTTYLNNTSK